ncbi:MAG: type II toxin-antitoxin system MqsA family antitoxin [Actinomycetota bacterium]|nr:type II toxin-antitoxin system MqsA family antitoxin [Actinomycetota bacterium]
MSEKVTQSVRTCPICGEQALATSADPVLVEFRNASYEVDGFTYEACSACGEALHPAGQIDRIQASAVAMARHDQGLLAPDEIRQLRSDLDLTQIELEAILGVGSKSVTRWEKGTVFQSAVADNFMRSIWAHPDIFSTKPETATSSCDDRLTLDCYQSADERVFDVGAVDNDFAVAA